MILIILKHQESFLFNPLFLASFPVDILILCKVFLHSKCFIIELKLSFIYEGLLFSIIFFSHSNDDYTASIDLDDLISKEISLLAKEMQRDDDNVEVKFAGSSSKSDNIGSSYDKLRSNNPPRFFNTSREGLNTIRESDDEYADYFSSRKAPNVRTSIRLDDILNSSVDTLGSTGFKALLLPELKLDGQ